MNKVNIMFKVKRWLSREEFEDLIQISDYLGRMGGYSIFRINIEKIKKQNLSYRDVMAILKHSNITLDERSKKILEEIISSLRTIEIFWDGVCVYMKPNFYLGSIYEEIKNMVEYDSKRKIFKIKPIYYFNLLEILKNKNVKIIDKTNLKESIPLGFNVNLKVKLRPYQEEAVKRWSTRKRGIIALPTGAGKTIIALAIIAELGERTLIVTYTKDQMMQWKDMIHKYTSITIDKVGLYYGDVKKIAPITITTYQTAYRHVHKLAPFFSLLIIDEVHHLPAEKFRYIALNMYAKHRLGLSATVIREDGKHEELFPLMGGIVYWKPASELVEEGYLATYRIKQVYVTLTTEEKKKLRELLRLYRLFARGRNFQELLKYARIGDEDSQRALSIHSRIRLLIHMAENKIKAIKEIVNRELKRNSKIIIFTQYVEQAKRLAKELDALLLTGELDARERSTILEKFRRSVKGVLVVTTVGDEGLDIPDANVGIIAAGTGSRRQFIQRLGRLLRRKDNKSEAILYEIIVKGTSEEIQSRKRKILELGELLEGLSEVDDNHL